MMTIGNEQLPQTTAIGSLPHHNADAALEYSFRHGIPFLPQMPVRNPWEYMIPQALEGLPGLEVSREGASYLVLSFSSIYLLCLVFEGDFDELRAERAAQESLPRVERLVAALPPLDPDPQPTGGVVALRGPRRR